MKLTLDGRMLFMSGIGRYIREVLRYLVQQQGIEITCLYPVEERARVEALPFYDKCRWIPMRSKIFSIREHVELLLKVPRCDLFWSPQYNVPLLLPHAGKRVATIHDVFQLHDFKNLSVVRKIYVALMINFCVLRSHKIVTVSRFSQHEIERKTCCAPNKLVCIYNGIDPDFGSNVEGQPAGRPYILLVGNVKPHKNLRTAILAYLKVEQQLPYDLVIVGKKDGFVTGDQQALEMAEGHPGIRFTGSVNDAELKRLYAHAALFVFPSLYEGFGLPVLEAMSFSLPIIASDIPVTRELFGSAVTLFEPTSVDALAACLVEHARTGPARKDYGHVLERFRWSMAAQHHLEVFRQLLG